MNGFSVWASSDDPHDTLLVVGRGLLYVATAKRGQLDTAHDLVRTGSDPERMLPKSRLRVKRDQLQEVRHQRDSEWIKFRYVDDQQKPRTGECSVGDSKRAVEAARTIAAEMQLSTAPREEMASIADITWGPAIAAGLLLPMLAIMYFAAGHADPGRPGELRIGRAHFLRDVANSLGPNGVLAVIALVVLAAGGYWFYRFIRRPAVDVYAIGAR